jgi:hypothetical protein
MYAAIKGNGGRVRLVMLPAEDHLYRARESVGHVLWEMIHFLDCHLRGTPMVGVDSEGASIGLAADLVSVPLR